MTRDTSVRYPALRDLLEEVSAQHPITNERLGKAIGKSPTTVSNYRNGIRAPGEELVVGITRAFFPLPSKGAKTDPYLEDRATFKKKLQAAIKARIDISSGDAPKSLLRKAITLTSADCLPISGNSDCAFENIATRFLDLCGMPYSEPQNRLHYSSDAITDSTVLLSVFDSAERMRSLKFFRIPLRMSLGCIAIQDQTKAEKIARALSYPHEKDAEIVVRPIVLPNSVGWIHCSKRLRYSESEMVTVKMQPGKKFEELLASQLMTEMKSRKTQIPVVVADELLCFKVLNSLAPECSEAFSVFPMNSHRASEEVGARGETPQYYISMAIQRGNAAFQEYMRDALMHFYSTELQTTARVWTRLAQRLLELLLNLARFPEFVGESKEFQEAMRWRAAWDWVKFTLHLDLKSIKSYTDPEGLPWRPILNRARQLVQQYLASEECTKLLSMQIALFSAEARLEGGNGNVVAKIFELFDVKPNDTIAALASPKELQHHLRIALLGDDRQLRITLREFHPSKNAADPDLRAARSLLRNLQALYEANNRKDSVDRIEQEIEHLADLYGEKNGLIILASLQDDPEKVVGSVCVRFNENGNESAELRFIWIDANYRRFGFGARLVQRGIDVAFESGYARTFVEVPPELAEAYQLALRIGFTPAPQALPHFPERHVLELKSERPSDQES